MSRFLMVWLEFLLTNFRPGYLPGVNIVYNINDYKEYFLGVNVAVSWGWQSYHIHVLIILKSGSINFLEPSGPVQGFLLPVTMSMDMSRREAVGY
jgi:hypothetical protein